jgi:hypothetical protein
MTYPTKKFSLMFLTYSPHRPSPIVLPLSHRHTPSSVVIIRQTAFGYSIAAVVSAAAATDAALVSSF